MDDRVRVLHVDDDPDFGDLTSTVLEREDERLTVETATSADEGLELLASERVDCIVSDYDLPGTSGIEFLEQVRAVYPELPFILFTGKGSEAVASDAISAGVTDYLQKRGGTEQYELLVNRIDNAVSQYRAERELERQNDLFQKAQDIADVGVWEYDVRSEEGWLSERAYRIHGLAPGDPISPERSLEFYQESDRGAVREAFTRAIEDGEPYDLEVRFRDANGEEKWLRTRGKPEFESGEVVSVRGTIQDITDRKQRQAVLKALHEVATEIQTEGTIQAACERTVRAAADVLELDLCTILVREGELLVPRATSAETLPGGTRPMQTDQGLAGKTYRSGESHIVDDAQADEDTDPAKETYRSGISVPIGEQGVFQAVSTEREAFDSEDVEFVELLVSHTKSAMDRIERERELERQNERLQEFASIVSHDLRNPLNVAQLHLQMARDGDGETDDHLDEVVRSHERMEGLIDDLLTLARAGEEVDDVIPVSLDEVALRGWQNVETEAARLELDTGAIILADESRLQQLFENLFRNAVEHGSTSPDSQARQDAGRARSSEPSVADAPEDTAEHGSTSPDSQARQDAGRARSSEPSVADAPEDAAEQGGDGVTIRVGDLDGGFFVADDGPGIPDDERGNVFESGYTTGQDGTGFGLAIVKDIVEAHDWEIEVAESEAGGARFEITGVQVRD